MQTYNTDTDEFDVEGFLNLLKTDLLAGVKELIEITSLHEVVHQDFEIDELDDRLETEEVDDGNEGDGNYMYSVLEFKLDGVSLGFVRFGGVYSSWDSSDWDEDDITLVEPRQVITTEYIAVDGSEDKNYDKVLPAA